MSLKSRLFGGSAPQQVQRPTLTSAFHSDDPGGEFQFENCVFDDITAFTGAAGLLVATDNSSGSEPLIQADTVGTLVAERNIQREE